MFTTGTQRRPYKFFHAVVVTAVMRLPRQFRPFHAIGVGERPGRRRRPKKCPDELVKGDQNWQAIIFRGIPVSLVHPRGVSRNRLRMAADG